MTITVHGLVQLMDRLSIETADIETEAIVEAAETSRAIFERVGGRYTIRGRGGRQVALRAAVGNVERIGGGRTRAIVKPYPKGFWLLVEKGSRAHIVAKGARNSRRRRSIETPILTPYGPKMFADHRGHGPIGHPYEHGKAESNRVLASQFPNVVARQVHAVFQRTPRRRRR